MRFGTLRAVLWTLTVFALGVWAQSRGWPAALAQYWPDVSYLGVQHIVLAAISCAIAIVVALPLGILLTRGFMQGWGHVVMQVAGLGTTIPTLAVLALAMTVLGLGTPPALFGLAFLTLLPILLNTVSGLRAIPAPLIEAARGMGMTGRQILFVVELPNAAFVIMAGIRTAVAINIGTVPLAFLIGGGGLGELIFSGIDLMEPSMLLAGALSTATLAILVDMLIAAGQYWLIPRGVNPLR